MPLHSKPTALASAIRSLIFLSGAIGGVAVAAPPQLPAIVSPPTTEHHPGKVVLVELVTPDVEAAKRFYGGLFNWQFRDTQTGGMHYVQASLDGEPVAGLVQKNLASGQQRQPAWLTFISVRDVDAAKAAATKHGAKVLFEPHTLPDRGREAVFADPQGAVFAVLASSAGDPPDELASPGEWIWSSLITRDLDAGAAFYQTLFDYEIFDVGEEDSQHVLFATENYTRASANPLPVTRPDAHSHWLNFVRVDNAEKAAAKAAELGGKIVVEPRADRHGGKLAVVTDPQGAHFGVMEWNDSDSKEGTQ